jgi:hypothetical protein
LTTKRFFTNSGQTKNTENFPEIMRNERLNLFFPNLIDVMDIAMWELDLNYRVVAANKKAFSIKEQLLTYFSRQLKPRKNRSQTSIKTIQPAMNQS